MRSKLFAKIVLLAVVAALIPISFIAFDSGGGLHADLTALAKGDYSRIADSDVAQMVRSAIDGKKADWTSGDINEDGVPELILLDTSRQLSGGPQPILAVFYVNKGKIENAILDFNDSTEYFFLGPDDSVVYFFNVSGDVIAEQYYRCVFTDEYDCAYTEGLVVANFLDGTDLNGEPQDREKWAKEHPDLADLPLEGVHCIRLSSGKEEDRLIEEEIDKQSFLAEYKALTGLAFSGRHELYSP